MRPMPAIILVLISAIGFIAWMYLNQDRTTGRFLYVVSVLAIAGCITGFMFGLRFLAEHFDRNK